MSPLTFIIVLIVLCAIPSASQTVCSTLSSGASTITFPFTDVVVFGASYVDNGWHNTNFINAETVLTTQDAAGTAQATGRASNGPLFPEVLVAGNSLQAGYLSSAGAGACVGNLLSPATLHNFAFSGATCDNTIFGMSATAQPFSVVQQVSQQLTAGSLAGLNQATTLYAFLPATQDMSGQGTTTTNTTIAQLLSQCYSNQIQALNQGVGAKYFLLGNMYPFDLAPQNAALTAAQKAVIAANVAALNSLLVNVPKAFTTAKVFNFDMHNLYVNQLIANPTTYYGSAANVVAACSANGAATTACTTAGVDAYLWWDVHHPTRATHRYISQAMFATLQQVSALEIINGTAPPTTPSPTAKPSAALSSTQPIPITIFITLAVVFFGLRN